MTPIHRQVADLFYPLTDFYSPHGAPRPRIVPMDGGALPSPYRELLVHEQDMTSKLESYWGATLHVHVLDKHVEPTRLTRQVVLRTDSDLQPVEFGAIRICLDRFEASVRDAIMACRRPLGAILNDAGLEFACRPNAYFSFECDDIARQAFTLTSPHMLYGRHNVLFDGADEMLAEVVEILPPLESSKTNE